MYIDDQCTVWFRFATGIEPILRRIETFGTALAVAAVDEEEEDEGEGWDVGWFCFDEVDFEGTFVEEDGDLAIEEDEDDREGEGPCGSFGEIFIWVLRSRNQARTLKRFGKSDEGRWLLVVGPAAVATAVDAGVPVGLDNEFTWDEWMYFKRNCNGASFSNWLVMRSNRSLSPWTRMNAHDS